MLQRIVELSLRFRGVVLALACIVTAYGIFRAVNSRFDVYPEFAPPQVVIQTEAPGLAPEEVEALVTRPIENALNGAPDLWSIRSQSIQGLSVVITIFSDSTEVYRARQIVSERLVEAVSRMPSGVHPPAMAPLTGATSLALIVGLTSEKRTAMDLRTFADWTLRPRLLGVPGVAKIVVFGGEIREIQVQVLPERLAAYDLSMSDVLAAARTATAVRGAGFIESPSQRIVLRTQGQALSPEEVGAVVLTHVRGASVRLMDVARVVEAPEPKIGDAAINGMPGVLLEISSQYGSNTLEVTRRLELALDEMRPALVAGQIEMQPRLFRPASFIERSIRNIGSSLLIGGLLVAVVLFLFLFNLRTAFISLTAIPLSLLVAVIVLDRFGQSLNTLTLGGLAIALGEVVDDAIIDVENIFRRLRENRALGDPKSTFKVVLDASVEVRSAVVYATFVVALVFLPVLTMSGIQGKLFAPLGWTYIFAVLASLLVALTVTPALCFFLLPRLASTAGETHFVAALKTRYQQILERVGRRPDLVLAAAVFLLLATAIALPFLGGSFLPDLREGHLIVHMSAIPGTSLQESLRLGRKVTQALLENPLINSVAQQIGRAEQADDTWGTHYSELHVSLKPSAGDVMERVESEIRQTLVEFPGVYFAIRPFLAERIEEVISGVTAQVVIKVFGENLDVMDQKAKEIANVLSGVRGAADVQVESPPGAPEMIVRLRPDRLRQFGFQPLPVLESIQAGYQGTPVAQAYEANRVINVSVILDSRYREDPEQVGSLIVQNSEGLRMPLRELAEIYSATGRYLILHDGTRRRQAVTCNVRNRDLASFVEEARMQVRAKISFPTGAYAAFAGTEEARAQAQHEILIYSLLAAGGVVILLAVVFRNARNLLLVMANLPFALVGGVIAVISTGGWMSVGSMVGFVTLFGITTRNSIMMISHFEHLVSSEGMTWGPQAAFRGASERLVPILMTALVTALGLLPLALRSGTPGSEIEGPMAIVILGGLVTSTLLNLLLLPTLALRFGKFGTAEAG